MPQKWPLLVRSLSDSAKYRHLRLETQSKALTLSLSDSRLFTYKHSLGDLHKSSNKEFEQETSCSCGCDQGDEEDLDYSEDEGCFVITNVPQNETEVTNKVRRIKALFFGHLPKIL